MEKNYAKKQRGITLVALVVTIVVLLILAGVSLNLVLGENGIVVKSREARTENDHSTVLEMLQMENSNYETEYATEDITGEFIEYLKKQKIIDENNVIDVKKLTGKELTTGKGTESDKYIIKKDVVDNSYKLEYIGEDSEDRELGTVGYEKNVEYDTTDLSIFEFEKETGSIALKNSIRSNYGSNEDIKLQVIVVPEEIDGVKVTKIGIPAEKDSHWDDANKGFGNVYVEKIILPNTITEIRDGVFRYCYNLREVDMQEGIISIGNNAFCNCQKLQKIEIPDSVESIGDSAFWSCKSLQKVTVPENIINIGKYAFAECSGLTIATIPSCTTNIGHYAFGGTESLTSINVDENNENYSSIDGVLFNKDQTTLLQYPKANTRTSYEIPESVKVVGNSAFFSVPNLKNVIIPSNVTEIERQGFGYYSNNSLTITLKKGSTLTPSDFSGQVFTSQVIKE